MEKRVKDYLKFSLACLFVFAITIFWQYSASAQYSDCSLYGTCTPEGGATGNVTSVNSGDGCIFVNPPGGQGNVIITFNTSCSSVGSVISVTGGDPYYNFNPTSGAVVGRTNTTQLNITIDARIALNPQGFITSATGNASYYLLTNPSNFINITTGQFFNDTTLINSVNSSIWSYINSNQAAWLTTFNATYNNILNQTCPAGNYTYAIQSNGTILCRSDLNTPTPLTNVAFLNNTQTFTANQVISANLTVSQTVFATLFSGTMHWSNLTGVPNIIYGLWTTQNPNNLLISNGTAIGYNQSIFNSSAVAAGVAAGLNSTFNETYNNILGQNCPAGQVVNGTLTNGTLRCTAVVATFNNTNIAYLNNTQTFTGNTNTFQNITYTRGQTTQTSFGNWQCFDFTGIDIGCLTSENVVFQFTTRNNFDLFFTNDDLSAQINVFNIGYVAVRAVNGFYIDNGAIRSFESNNTRTHVYGNLTGSGDLNSFTKNVFIGGNITFNGTRIFGPCPLGNEGCIANFTGWNITSNHQSYNMTNLINLDTTYRNNNTNGRPIKVSMDFDAQIIADISGAIALVTLYVNGTEVDSEGMVLVDLGASAGTWRFSVEGDVQPGLVYSFNSSTSGGGQSSVTKRAVWIYVD